MKGRRGTDSFSFSEGEIMTRRYSRIIWVLILTFLINGCGSNTYENDVTDVPVIVENGTSDIPDFVREALNKQENMVSIKDCEIEGVPDIGTIMCPYTTPDIWNGMALENILPEWGSVEVSQAEGDNDSVIYSWFISEQDDVFQELTLDMTQKNGVWTDIERNEIISCLDGQWQSCSAIDGEYFQTYQGIPVFWYDIESPYQKEEMIYGTVLYISLDGKNISIYGANPRKFEDSDIYVDSTDLIELDRIGKYLTEYLDWKVSLTDTNELKNVYDWILQSVQLCYLPLPDGSGKNVLTPCWYITIEEYSATFLEQGNVNYYHNDFLPVILMDAVSGQIYDQNTISIVRGHE